MMSIDHVHLIYPLDPIDIDGDGRHFVIASECNGFGERSESVFNRCINCVHLVMKHLGKRGDRLHILEGGDLDGKESVDPWHIQVLLFQPLKGWKSEAHTIANAMPRRTLSQTEYERFFKGFLEEIPI